MNRWNCFTTTGRTDRYLWRDGRVRHGTAAALDAVAGTTSSIGHELKGFGKRDDACVAEGRQLDQQVFSLWVWLGVDRQGHLRGVAQDTPHPRISVHLQQQKKWVITSIFKMWSQETGKVIIKKSVEHLSLSDDL